MSKQGGLGDNLYVGGYDLSGDAGEINTVGGGPAPLVTTGIDKSAMERIGGRRDGRLQWRSFFNDAAGQAHPVLSALPTADVICTYCRGTTLGNPAAALTAKQINYDPTRGNDGALTIDVSAEASGFGVEWGKLLTAGRRVDTTATNGTGVDFGAAGSNGLQAYLHVFAFTGTSVTITIEESSDDGSGDAYGAVTGGAFAAVSSAPTTERIATSDSQAVEQYLRVATSGTFSNVDFAVVAIINETAVVF